MTPGQRVKHAPFIMLDGRMDNNDEKAFVTYLHYRDIIGVRSATKVEAAERSQCLVMLASDRSEKGLYYDQTADEVMELIRLAREASE